MYYFYVLQSMKKPEYLYKGSTSDLKRRLAEHNAGETKSNKPYLPFRIVYYEAYLTESSYFKRNECQKERLRLDATQEKNSSNTEIETEEF